jgi:hypothetical protein
MSASPPANATDPHEAPRAKSRVSGRPRYLPVPYRRLFWRIFRLSAAVLALACALAVVVFSPSP